MSATVTPLQAVKVVVSILKSRFNSLTTEEVLDLAIKIVEALEQVRLGEPT